MVGAQITRRLAGVILAAALLLIEVPVSDPGYAAQDVRVRNVIVLLGDGMGANHVRVAEMYAEAVLDRTLSFSTLPVRSPMLINSLESAGTDSAASITALLSGYKTKNAMLNMLPDGEYVYSLGEAAQAAGKSVGFITTTRLTHATPAGIYGHVAHRSMENELADQMVAFAPDVALGGGLRHFLPQSDEDSVREDDHDPLRALGRAGYMIVRNRSELQAIDLERSRRLVGLFRDGYMTYDFERTIRDRDEPSLAEMTAAALAVLDNNTSGFFLLVEAGRIDHAAHVGDTKTMILEVLAFDDAIRVALDFQAANPDTLVIVTADHETGGLRRMPDTAQYIGTLEPIACNMGYLNDLLDDADVLEVVADCGIPLTDEDKALLREHPADMDPEQMSWLDDVKVSTWAQYVLSGIIARNAHVEWTTSGHTPQAVFTYAIGPGEERYAGLLDNTDVAWITADLLGVTLGAHLGVAAPD